MITAFLSSDLWHPASLAWLPALAAIVAYARVFGARAGRRAWFMVGAAVVFLAMYVSPIGRLASGYLFSAHMIQHITLLLLVPLLVLLALPEGPCEAWFARPRADRIGRLFSLPLLGWILGLGAMWGWHEPAACSASIQMGWLGLIRDVSFLGAGLAFWWPVAAPVARYRLVGPVAVVYMLSACVGCTLLGIYITFASRSVCPVFLSAPADLAVLNRVRSMGFTPGVDQQLGGLLMWVPPCTLYVAMSLRALRQWYRLGLTTEDSAPEPAAKTTGATP